MSNIIKENSTLLTNQLYNHTQFHWTTFIFKCNNCNQYDTQNFQTKGFWISFCVWITLKIARDILHAIKFHEQIIVFTFFVISTSKKNGEKSKVITNIGIFERKRSHDTKAHTKRTFYVLLLNQSIMWHGNYFQW